MTTFGFAVSLGAGRAAPIQCKRHLKSPVAMLTARTAVQETPSHRWWPRPQASRAVWKHLSAVGAWRRTPIM